MLYLVTGLPGASKSLNTLKYIIENDDWSGREIYYNNVKLLMLDIDVCHSFSGWFYGVYIEQLKKSDPKLFEKVMKVVKRVHKAGDFCSLDTFPHLVHLFNAWLDSTGPLDLFVFWCRKLYSAKRQEPLNDYLAMAETVTIEHLKMFNLHFTHFDNAANWHTLPHGSVIFVDECQQTFPPRAAGSRVPLHCSEFETHRHKGFDVFLVTQDAMLLDNHVRRLVGAHMHFFRPFGGSLIKRQWADKVFNPEDYFQAQQAQTKPQPRDSNYYGLYWSADEHTHKFKAPLKLLMIFPVIITSAFLIYYVTSGAFFNSSEPSETSEPDSSSLVSGLPSASTPAPQAVQSTDRKILPYVQLATANTPISGMCLEITYGGYQVVRRQKATVTHFFNCVVKHPEKETNNKPSPEASESQQSQSPDSGLVITLDAHYFEAMGFKFSFYKYTPILAYDNFAYMFPRVN